MPTTISLLNQKGGAGKSTMALALATTAAEAGRDVLLVDADPQGTVSAWGQARRLVGLQPLPNLEIVAHAKPDLHSWLPTVDGGRTVFVDGPPRADEALSRSVIAASALVLIPLQPSLPDLWAARSTIGLVKAASSSIRVSARLVLSRVKGGSSFARDFGAMVVAEGVPLLPAGTGDRIAYAAAISGGQTLAEYEPKGRAAAEAAALWEAVEQVAREIEQ